MSLGEKLEQLRKQHDLTLDELTDNLNETYSFGSGVNMFSKGKLWKWENGKSEPKLFTLYTLAKYYDISLDELIEESM